MKKLINTLKKSNKIKRMYTTKEGHLLSIENHKGTVIDISIMQHRRYSDDEKTSWMHTDGYKWHYPIKPNRTTGSGMAGTGDYFDYIDFDSMVKVAEDMGFIIPNWYKPSEIPTVKRQSFDDNKKHYSFYNVKIK